MNTTKSKTKENPKVSSLFDEDFYMFGDTPKNIENCTIKKELISANKHECLINIPKVADYYINKHGINIDAKTDDAHRLHQIKVFSDIYAYPCYIYINTKKDLLLNASAVKNKDGKAVLFCGVSSSGKSTIANELCNQGAEFIADEFVKVFFQNGKVYAKGYHPYFILSKKSLDATDAKSLKLIYPNSYRYIVYPEDRCTDACEIDTVIILKSSYTDSVKADSITGEEKYKIFRALYI